MTTTPEQIEAVARAMCDTKWGEGYWDEVMPYARREYKRQAASAIDTMRPFIRAEVLEEAADVVGEVGDCAEAGAYIAAIRALKDT